VLNQQAGFKMKAELKKEIRNLKKELKTCTDSFKIVDITSLIEVLQVMLEDLN